MKTVEQYESGLTAGLLSCFEAANTVNKQTTFRASMPYRIGAAIMRAVKGRPVTLRALDHYDGCVREALISPDPAQSIRQLLEDDSFFKAYHPEGYHLEKCLRYCSDGRGGYATLIAAHALAVRAYAAGEGKGDYQALLLDSWRIINAKVIANQEAPGWHVDDNDCFRPRLRWNQGGKSSMYRECPRPLQEESRAEALRLLRSESD